MTTNENDKLMIQTSNDSDNVIRATNNRNEKKYNNDKIKTATNINHKIITTTN